MMRALRKAVLVSIVVLLQAACTSSEVRQEEERMLKAADYNTQLGINYMRDGNLEQAKFKLERALEQNPKSAVANNAYAVLQERLGDVDLADKHYRRAVDLNPEDSNAHNNYGTFLCKHNRLREADKQFRLALKNPLYKTPESAYTNAGVCALKIPDEEKAEEYFRKALSERSDYLPALYELAALSFEQGRYLQARAFLQRYDESLSKFAARNPKVPKNNPRVLWLCVQTERALKNRSAADSCALKLKQMFPDSRETTLLLESERYGGRTDY